MITPRPENPYPPGSPEARSFEGGVSLAQLDSARWELEVERRLTVALRARVAVLESAAGVWRDQLAFEHVRAEGLALELREARAAHAASRETSTAEIRRLRAELRAREELAAGPRERA